MRGDASPAGCSTVCALLSPSLLRRQWQTPPPAASERWCRRPLQARYEKRRHCTPAPQPAPQPRPAENREAAPTVRHQQYKATPCLPRLRGAQPPRGRKLGTARPRRWARPTFCANASAALVLSPVVMTPTPKGCFSATALYHRALPVSGASSVRPTASSCDMAGGRAGGRAGRRAGCGCLLVPRCSLLQLLLLPAEAAARRRAGGGCSLYAPSRSPAGTRGSK